MKLLKNDISCQLSEIINLSFSSGVFPSILKTAKVIPVHKKVSKLDFANFPSISPQSDIEKVLESLIESINRIKRIYKYFRERNRIYHLQFGIKKTLVMDFKKAFGTVEHDIHLSMLEHYDMHGPLSEWFKCYL